MVFVEIKKNYAETVVFVHLTDDIDNRVVGSSENPEVPVFYVGHNLPPPPPWWIGLTDLRSPGPSEGLKIRGCQW